MYALLPMKGHSERVPNKNVKSISGKPLFFFIADTLKDSSAFDSLIINTDSEEISFLAKERYGNWVVVHKRPEELVGDSTSMNEIIRHDVKKIGEDNNFFQTHSTNPLLKIETVQSSVNEYRTLLDKGNFDSLFSVTSMKKRLYDHRFNPINHNPKDLKQTQDLENIYEENSNFYIFSGKSFLENNHRIGCNPKMHIMESNSFESLDIDEKNDWVLAEILLQKLI